LNAKYCAQTNVDSPFNWFSSINLTTDSTYGGHGQKKKKKKKVHRTVVHDKEIVKQNMLGDRVTATISAKCTPYTLCMG
jgi:hypothetical protein